MDSIKITSTVSTPKVNDAPSKHSPGDSIFDIKNIDNAVKITPVAENYQQESFRETLFQNLQRDSQTIIKQYQRPGRRPPQARPDCRTF